MNMKNHFSKINLLLIILMLGTFVSIHFYWRLVCSVGKCSYELMDTFLFPFYYGSLSLAAFFGFFLFLPAHYFASWFKWMFSWAFPISVLIVMSNVTNGGNLFPIFAREVIIILSVFWGLVTILFVGWRWWKTRK